MNPFQRLDSEPVLGPSLRRLYDEPLDYAYALLEQFGSRGATTLGEAQAAAYLDGRLRRAGMKVSADAFEAPTWNGWDGTVLGVLMIVAAIVYRWQPVLALCIIVFGLVFAALRLMHSGRPFLTQWRPSQNIIATRALAQQARVRVVVMAPLDSPPVMPPLVRLLHDGDRALVGAVIACGALIIFAFGGMVATDLTLRRLCWFGLLVVACYFVVAIGLDHWMRRLPATTGAVNSAGALASVLACSEELTSANQVELWVVALGATYWGSGLRDVLRRYPFEPTRTVFIALEGIGSGQLSYLTRTGLLVQQAADSSLLEQIAALDAEDTLINAEPRPYRQGRTTVGLLRRAGWRAVGIACLGSDGQPPFRGSADDVPVALDADVLNRTVRLIVGLVRRIDKEADHQAAGDQQLARVESSSG